MPAPGDPQSQVNPTLTRNRQAEQMWGQGQDTTNSYQVDIYTFTGLDVTDDDELALDTIRTMALTLREDGSFQGSSPRVIPQEREVDDGLGPMPIRQVRVTLTNPSTARVEVRYGRGSFFGGGGSAQRTPRLITPADYRVAEVEIPRYTYEIAKQQQGDITYETTLTPKFLLRPRARVITPYVGFIEEGDVQSFQQQAALFIGYWAMVNNLPQTLDAFDVVQLRNGSIQAWLAFGANAPMNGVVGDESELDSQVLATYFPNLPSNPYHNTSNYMVIPGTDAPIPYCAVNDRWVGIQKFTDPIPPPNGTQLPDRTSFIEISRYPDTTRRFAPELPETAFSMIVWG